MSCDRLVVRARVSLVVVIIIINISSISIIIIIHDFAATVFCVYLCVQKLVKKDGLTFGNKEYKRLRFACLKGKDVCILL